MPVTRTAETEDSRQPVRFEFASEPTDPGTGSDGRGPVHLVAVLETVVRELREKVRELEAQLEEKR